MALSPGGTGQRRRWIDQLEAGCRSSDVAGIHPKVPQQADTPDPGPNSRGKQTTASEGLSES
jgi:hypothetical protein